MDTLTFLEVSTTKQNVSILPIALSAGSDNGDDTAAAPQYLLDLGLREALEHPFEGGGCAVSLLPGIESEDIAEATGEARALVAREIRRGQKILALGGDHSIVLGTAAGAADALGTELGLIYIDVHGDLHTQETSISKNIHGMALATLIQNNIKAEHVLCLGHKDLEQAEVDYIRTHNLMTVPMYAIAEEGLGAATPYLTELQKRVSAVWVSIDVDAVDGADAPATVMGARGGFTYREITSLVNRIGKMFTVVGVDLVEVAPAKDIAHKTGELCIELAALAFGGKHNWYTKHMSPYRHPSSIGRSRRAAKRA